MKLKLCEVATCASIFQTYLCISSHLKQFSKHVSILCKTRLLQGKIMNFFIQHLTDQVPFLRAGNGVNGAVRKHGKGTKEAE